MRALAAVDCSVRAVSPLLSGGHGHPALERRFLDKMVVGTGHDWQTMQLVNRQLGRHPNASFSATRESFKLFLARTLPRATASPTRHGQPSVGMREYCRALRASEAVRNAAALLSF